MNILLLLLFPTDNDRNSHGCAPKLSSDPTVIEKIEASVRVLMDHLDNGYCIYGMPHVFISSSIANSGLGVNTGFGGSADSRTDRATSLQAALLQLTQAGILISSDKNDDQTSTLSSHAMPAPWVRASIAVRANSNSRGHSAVTLPVLESLMGLLQNKITPVIPLRGSISASGDLMPLSYIAGAVEGSPDVYVHVEDPSSGKRRVMTARDALQDAGMDVRTMGPKEGLGLVNGTSCSAALASLALHESHQLAIMTQALSAMGVEALMGTAESFHPFISAIRPHDGQLESAQMIMSLLQGSQLAVGVNREKDRKRSGLIQDRYAFRSVPQWVGPYLEDLLLADRQISTELNSTCDNPLVDTANEEIYCGANFQATSVTSAMEKTRLSLQMFGKLLFSQATEMVDPNYNNGLPTNLVADEPNMSFTMKGVDISMAAYMAELAYVANPVSSHVQTAEMRNQAVNSMAFVSGRYTMQAVELVSLMSACTLYINCQALDLRALHLAFLDKVTPQLHVLASSVFGSCLSQDELLALQDALAAHVVATWPTTTRVPSTERCEKTVKTSLPIVLAAVKSTAGGTSPSIADLDRWQTEAVTLMKTAYDEAHASFVEKPHTADLLGAGSKVLYQTVRETLGVPFHLGFIEHPTAQNDSLNGREKKTVGSWVSIIYEALRTGKLQAPLMAMLKAGLQRP